MPGYKHTPQNDIDNIRDLLRGYGNADTILKELIQNAEDANATQVDFLYVKKMPEDTLPHPLLEGPALCMINNGNFTPADQNAIFQIGSGTKVSDDRKIGRFGKGLKSVHALCEAYFLIASDEVAKAPEWNGENLWLMNPYGDWRHTDWENTFESSREDIRKHCIFELNKRGWGPGDKWLTFWLPLRRQSHLTDTKGQVRPIHVWGGNIKKQPGDDPHFTKTIMESFNRLPWRVLLLHRLEKIGLSESDSPLKEEIIFTKGSTRPTNPHDLKGIESIKGGIVAGSEIGYTGLAGLLSDPVFEDLHRQDGWPRAADPTGSSDSITVKGTQHFACVFSSGLKEEPKLRIQWAVFLPINEQPDARSLPKLDRTYWPKGISLTLHGCFFLDSTRTHIDGLAGEGFEAAIKNFDADRVGANKTTLEWNKELAYHGPLAHLPATLHQFIYENDKSDAAIQNLIEAFRETWTWKRYARPITSKQSYLRTFNNGLPQWKLISSEDRILLIPVPIDMNPARIWELLPGLNKISDQLFILHSAEPKEGLFPEQQFCDLDETSLVQLLKEVDLNSDEDRLDFLRWLALVPREILEAPNAIEALQGLAIIQACSLHNGENAIWMTHDQAVEALNQRNLYQPTNESELFTTILTSHPEIWILTGHQYLNGTKFHPFDLFQENAPCIGPRDVASWINQEHYLPAESEPRIQMIQWLQRQCNLAEDPVVRQAARYLLHRNYDCRDNLQDSLLYATPEAQNTVWEKCLQILFSFVGEAASWRMLDPDLIQSINDPSLLQELNVHGINAQGTLRELKIHSDNLNDLHFDPAQWTMEEISELVAGLYQANRPDSLSILRKLPIHRIKGIDDSWHAIGETDGSLKIATFLDTTNFNQEFPQDVDPQWTSLLKSFSIVQRLPSGDIAETAQRELFRVDQSYRELIWSEVIGHALNQETPADFVQLILYGLQIARGDAMTGHGDRLRSEKLFVSPNGRPFSFTQIHHIPGLEQVLETIFQGNQHVITWNSLPEWLRSHRGFLDNRYSLTPQPLAIFKALAQEFKTNSNWWLGLSGPHCPPNDFRLPRMESLAACTTIPVADTLKKLYNHKPRNLDEADFWQNFYPAVVQAWPANEIDRRLRLFEELRQLPDRGLHDLYLQQLGEDGLLPTVISELTLLSQSGEWQSSHDLIWPTAGPPNSRLLHTKHNDIIAPYLNPPFGHGNPHAMAQPIQLDNRRLPNRAQNAEELVAYLESIRDKFPEHNEDYPILAASLIAVCFEYEILRDYAEDCLIPVGRDFETIRNQLFHGNGAGALQFEDLWTSGIFVFQFQDPAIAIEWDTVAGGNLTLEVDEDIPHLLVQTRRTQNRLGLYNNMPVRILTFRNILDPAAIEDLIHVWRRTLKEIVANGYESNGQLLPNVFIPDFTSLQKMLGRAYPLERVQRALLDKGEQRLDEVRCSLVTPFDSILRDFQRARELRLDAEEFERQGMAHQAAERKKQESTLRRNAESDLRKAVTSNPPTEAEALLVDKLRAKLTDYGYSASSVLLELFQNADDAVSESILELNATPSRTFEIRWNPDSQNLTIIHWGRRINYTMGRDRDDPQFRVFQRDLEKMLSLNLSDKASQQDQNIALTGRFGLGFKSVFFLCPSPRIHSNPIHCKIRGGFFPERILSQQDPSWQRFVATVQNVEEATIFDLPDIGNNVPIDDLLSRFEEVTPYLIQFSRALSQLKIQNGVVQSAYSRAHPQNASWSVEPGPNNNATQILRIFNDDQSHPRASWILHLDAKGFVPVSDNIPKIWATAPTEEPSKVPACLNGDWIPDAGRMRIARQIPENKEVARKLAGYLARALRDIVKASETSFLDLQSKLGLSKDTDIYAFWFSFWKIITRAKPVVSWEAAVRQGEDLTSAILWCEEFGALPNLIQHHSMIPSGLHEDYRTLRRMDDIKFSFDGCLGEDENDLGICYQLESFRTKYPPGEIVSQEVAVFLESIRDSEWKPQTVNLDRIVSLYICEMELCIGYSEANELGKLIHRDSLKRWEENNHGKEVSSLRQNTLEACRFQVCSDGYHCARDLLVKDNIPGASDYIDIDERLRAAFAPPDRILNADQYTFEGIRFFTACRGVLKADRRQLAEWARLAAGEKLSSVFRYCIQGDRGIAEGMANELGVGWLEEQLQSPEYNALSQEEQQSIRRLFALVSYDIEITTDSPTAEIQPYQCPKRALIAIADWWEAEKDQQLRHYLSDQYDNLRPTLHWPEEDDFGLPGDEPNLQARISWMLLLIHAALHTQGWTQSAQSREFVSLFSRQGWLRTLANPNSSPENILGILDQFADQGGQQIAYYHPMREFISFYLSRKHLDGILSGLQSIRHAENSFPLSKILSIRQNPQFAGTGIDAPSFVRSFGMGANFILRELYRSRKLENKYGQEHCFVPRLRVRQLSEWLFNIPGFSRQTWREDASRTLYRKLQELAEGTLIDITFDHCYDIPLQILIQNPFTLKDILGECIDFSPNDIEPISTANE